MPVGEIDCPSSASVPRDCSHECRVCRVTVVGLSTYAKHISSNLHKDNVEAQNNEEEKDEEEEYFDKELIQLIDQRREQSEQEEARSVSKEQELDRYQRRDDRFPYPDRSCSDWHQRVSERSWQWQNECFGNPRQNFLHKKHSANPHINNTRGQAGWHMNSQSHQQMGHVNVQGSWHSNAGGATNWHQRGTGGSFHWHAQGRGNFTNQHSRNSGGNWQSNSCNNNQWNFGEKAETFPQGRNWPQRHCDSGQDQDSGWSKNNSTSSTFCKERFKWKNSNNASNGTFPTNNNSSEVDDFTSDCHIEDNFTDFKMLVRSDSSFKTNPTLCLDKSNSLTRDKPHRWSPYPSQRFSDQITSQGADKTNTPCSQKTKSGDLTPEQEGSSPKLKEMEDYNVSDVFAQQPDGKKGDHSELRNPRMPSLKSPLRNIPDVNALAVKKDQKNPLKGVKVLYPPFAERPNRLSALNLETVRSNSSISKLCTASKCTKTNPETRENNHEEPVETLGEVLRKAKEMLRNSQAIQSPYIPSSSAASGTSEATKVSFQNETSSDSILEGGSNDFSNNVPEMGHLGKPFINSDRDYTLKVDGNIQSTEQIANNPDINPFPFNSTEKGLTNESLDIADEGNSHQFQDFNDDDYCETASDFELQKSATNSSNPVLPELSKLGLPVSLQRDLTRHISSKSKAGTYPVEPNLHNARRIRNVSGHRKSDSDKDSGLKPTLRQILNVPRRNINWEQVTQQVMKKRQELGKGLPRFGIEMVTQVQSEQEGLYVDEETDLGIESYQWKDIIASPLPSVRKRSLSESSVAVEKASVYDLIHNHTSDSDGEPSVPARRPTAPGPKAAPELTLPIKQEEEDTNFFMVPAAIPSRRVSDARSCDAAQMQGRDEGTCVPSDSSRMLQRAWDTVEVPAVRPTDGGTDSCASGTEQNDIQGVGKKRRATRDGSCPETSNLERNSKRRKIRGRRERTQVDQLLSISLREEDLNSSLQGIDDSLNQARAALQAAYLEVQHFMVLKQQITGEMSSLRTQRIQILQGLQGTFESANDAEEAGASLTPAPQAPDTSCRNLFPFLLEAPPILTTQTPSNTLLPAPVPIYTPPAALQIPVIPALPDSSVSIKQEPMSPEVIPQSISAPRRSPPSLQTAAPPEINGEDNQNKSVYPIITAIISLSELANKFPPLNTEAAVEKQSVSTATSPPPPCVLQTPCLPPLCSSPSSCAAPPMRSSPSLYAAPPLCSSSSSYAALPMRSSPSSCAAPPMRSSPSSCAVPPLCSSPSLCAAPPLCSSPTSYAAPPMRSSPSSCAAPPMRSSPSSCAAPPMRSSPSSCAAPPMRSSPSSCAAPPMRSSPSSCAAPPMRSSPSSCAAPPLCISQPPLPLSQFLPVGTSKETNCSTAPAELVHSTLITAETKVSKKKKRFRKKKTLRPAHVPENSDTEQESNKPFRKVKGRRPSKEGAVSTSTSVELEVDTGLQDTEMNKDIDSDSSIEVMEVPKPCVEVIELDSNDEKPDSPSQVNLPDLSCVNQGSLEVNNEVTSTSELGALYTEDKLGSSNRLSTPGTKNSSDVSSDPGEYEEPTEGSFEKHKASVNAIQVYCSVLYTCSADKSVRAYNLVTRKCTAVFKGHTAKVNCLLVTNPRRKNIVLYTGSSDNTIRSFDVTTYECIDVLDVGERVLCLHARWRIMYAGLANGTVVRFSLKNNRHVDTFDCHGPRAVSCLATAQEGSRRLLLVGSYDCTISIRDANNGLLIRTLEGHTKTVLCMKVVNDLVFSGSSDQSVHAHNLHTGEMVRIYKGHSHAVTVVTILGQVMVTACLDKFVRVYELQSHDRLQIYGGHSDMIMCMAIYKSMIYTGCYDGSVQAVRLNLMQNYRCWWHGCSLIFGVMDHLKQHLLNDHTNPNFQTLKCRWKNCDGFFTARRGTKQEAIEHMERHAEEGQVTA